MSRAFIFPGQGAQTVGMGQDLAAAYPEARAVFEEVDAALGEKLSALIWEGNQVDLTLTRNAQPALMATSMAVMAALEAEGIGIDAATYVAGHSLGEYSALAAAGSLSVADAARLLRLRGEAMQDAVPVGEGAMAAILGLDLSAVRKVVAESADQQVLAAANDNDPAQVVISGNRGAVMRAVENAKAAGAKRAVMLPVSAPFHCELMQPAAARMAEALSRVDISEPAVPVVGNVTAHAETSATLIRDHLIDQVCAPVRWRESVEWMVANGVTEFWEIGAGKALSGMVRRIAKEAQTRAISSPADVKAAAETVRG